MNYKKQKIEPSNKGSNPCLKEAIEILNNEPHAFNIIQRFKKENDNTYRKIIACLKQKPLNKLSKQVCLTWLSRLLTCVNYLNNDAEKIAIDTLYIPWEYEDELIQEQIHNLYESLVTHVNISVEPVIECLFNKLKPVITGENIEALRENPFGISEETLLANDKIIHLIGRVLAKVPRSSQYIDKYASSSKPYITHHVFSHIMFTYNLLRLAETVPSKRSQFLEFIIQNMIQLDLHAPKKDLVLDPCSDDEEESDNESEDMFPMEMDEEINTPSGSRMSHTTHPIGHSLDMTMYLMLRYIHFKIHGGDLSNLHDIMQSTKKPLEICGCVEGSVSKRSVDGTASKVVTGCGCRGTQHNIMAIKQLYFDLNSVFIKIILPTDKIAHVQFLMFYLLCSRPTLLVSEFLDVMKKEFANSYSNDVKKNALAYLGSFLARGKCVQFFQVHYILNILFGWCVEYYDKQEKLGMLIEDLDRHKPFYSACQTLFYVFTFNYKSYTSSDKNYKCARSLLFNQLVSCRLNPLRFCSESTRNNFARITNYLKLVYCNSILMRNSRMHLPVANEKADGIQSSQSQELDMFFPFDSYLLERSNIFICKHYRKFDGFPDDMLNEDAETCNETNIDMDENSPYWNSPGLLYNMSPHISCK